MENIEGLTDLALRGALDLMARRVEEGFDVAYSTTRTLETYLGCNIDTGGLWWTNAGSRWSPDDRGHDMEILASAFIEEA